jgi:hypothetical protein
MKDSIYPKGWHYGDWSKGCKSIKAPGGMHFWHGLERAWVRACLWCWKRKYRKKTEEEKNMKVRITKTWGYGDKSKVMLEHEKVCTRPIGELREKFTTKEGKIEYRVVFPQLNAGCWAKEFVII